MIKSQRFKKEMNNKRKEYTKILVSFANTVIFDTPHPNFLNLVKIKYIY